MLSDEHREFLKSRAITDEVIDSCGIQSRTSKPTGIVFPWRSRDGEEVFQLRPDHPIKDAKGRLMKYLFPEDSPLIMNKLRDADDGGPILIVEGTKQQYVALSYAPPEYAVYGLSGCWGWVDQGKVTWVPDLMWTFGRAVYLLFDADLDSNHAVWSAASEYTKQLKRSGVSEVKYVQTTARGSNGLDDVLSALPEDRRATMLALWLSQATGKLPKKPRLPKTSGFFKEDGSLLVKQATEAVLRENPAALTAERSVALYMNGAYRIDRSAMISKVVDLLGDDYRMQWRETIEETAIGILYSQGLILPDHITVPLLNVRNGMLDLATMTLKPHDPSYMSSSQIPIEWDADAKCPAYEEWIYDRIGDQVDDLEEASSVMLDPSRTPTKAVFAFGPSRSGKSTFIRILQEIVGNENRSAVTLHQLSDDKFAAANVYGKILNSAADISTRHVDDLSIFKMMAGEDSINGNRKYGAQFTFTNRALFAFSANEPPTVGEVSRAYLERIKPFEFPRSYAGRENPEIEEAIMRELSGVVVRLVRAWQRMRERGHYLPTNPAVRRRFEVKSNRVLQWLTEEKKIVPTETVTVGMDGGSTLTALYQSFVKWAEDQKSKPMGKKTFTSHLESQNGVKEVRIGPNKTRGYNIVTKSEKDHQEDDLEGGKGGSFVGMSLGRKEKNESGKSATEGGDINLSGQERAKLPPLPPVSDSEGNGSCPIPTTSHTANGASRPGIHSPVTTGSTSGPTPASGTTSVPSAPTSSTKETSSSAASRTAKSSATDVPMPENVIPFDLEAAGLVPSIFGFRPHDLSPQFVKLAGFVNGHGPEIVPPSRLMELINDPANMISGHNITGFDLIALARHHGLDLRTLIGRVADTDLLVRLDDPPPSGKDGIAIRPRGYYGLSQSAARYGGTGKTDDLARLARQYGGYDMIPNEDPEYRSYLEGDLAAQAALSASLTPLTPYGVRENTIGLITAQMTLNGSRVDVEENTRTLMEQADRKESAKNTLHMIAGMPLNKVTSYKTKPDKIEPYAAPLATKAGKEAIVNALIECGISEDALPRTAKTGEISLSGDLKQSLKDFYADHPEKRGEIRDAGRMRQIIDLVQQLVGERTIYQTVENCRIGDRVHPSIRPYQASGRWSVTEPGLTVFGKRGGRHVERRVILPEEGHYILTVDLAQVDMRAVAAHSGDEAYLEIFRAGRDLHTEVALAVFGDKKMRETAKFIGHGWNYGESVNRMVTGYGVDRALAIQFDQEMRRKYPKLVEWQEAVREEARADRLLPNGFGRLMRADPRFAYTQAPALVGQGCTRDILAEGLLRLPLDLWPYLRVIVHDEIVMSVPIEDFDEIARVVVESMSFDLGEVTNGELASVPITAEANKPGARTWAEAYEK
jgi:putative DNA primase/helicase